MCAGKERPISFSRASSRSSAWASTSSAGLGDLRAAVADGAVDLAATDLAREVLAQLALRGAQLVRQAEAGFEEAVVDAAQLADERTPGAGDLAPREACHAGDHWLNAYAPGVPG